MKWKTLIIDDERLARDELRRMLQAHEQIEIVGEAANAAEARQAIEEQHPDLLMLDIQMPGENGFELLASLENQPFEVIFTTAYDEFALKAFDFSAMDYLLKPIDTDRLAAALAKLEPEEDTFAEGENTSPLGLDDQVFIKDGERCWLVRLHQVRYFESVGNYVRIHFGKNKPLILRSLNALEKRLDPNNFFRANRKHIVNLQEIDRVEPYFSGGLVVFLSSGERIEISRRQAVRFKEKLSL